MRADCIWNTNVMVTDSQTRLSGPCQSDHSISLLCFCVIWTETGDVIDDFVCTHICCETTSNSLLSSHLVQGLAQGMGSLLFARQLFPFRLHWTKDTLHKCNHPPLISTLNHELTLITRVHCAAQLTVECHLIKPLLWTPWPLCDDNTYHIYNYSHASHHSSITVYVV